MAEDSDGRDSPGSDPEAFMANFLDGFDPAAAASSDDEDSDSCLEARFKHRPGHRGWVPTFHDMVDLKQSVFPFELSAAGADPARIELEIGYRSCGGHAVTASSVWDAAITVARWLEMECPGGDPTAGRAMVRGKHVIELGAGTGFAGVAAAALGAKTVVITDLEDALPLLARNAARFNTSTTRTNRVVTAAAMPWGPAPLDDFRAAEGIGVRGNDPGTAQSQHGQPRFDTVIVADCLLPGSTHLFPLLASTLGALVSCPSAANPDVGAEVLFAYERRMDCTEFFALVEAAGLENAEVPIEALHPRFCAPEIHVVRMRRRRRTLNETKTRT